MLKKYLRLEYTKHKKKLINPNQVGIISGMQDWFNIQKSINEIHHVNKLTTTTNNKYLIISVDAGKHCTNFDIHSW